jgi:hypothetical protein
MDYIPESESEEKRFLFDAKLKEITELTNVYYDPPESVLMEYPAIVYKKTNMPARYANNKKYIKRLAFEVKVIAEDADTKYVDLINDMDFSHYDRHYVAYDLHHDVFTIIF